MNSLFVYLLAYHFISLFNSPILLSTDLLSCLCTDLIITYLLDLLSDLNLSVMYLSMHLCSIHASMYLCIYPSMYLRIYLHVLLFDECCRLYCINILIYWHPCIHKYINMGDGWKQGASQSVTRNILNLQKFMHLKFSSFHTPPCPQKNMFESSHFKPPIWQQCQHHRAPAAPK